MICVGFQACIRNSITVTSVDLYGIKFSFFIVNNNRKFNTCRPPVDLPVMTSACNYATAGIKYLVV